MFLSGWGLWMARAHLRDVVRKAIYPNCEVDDSAELLSYRMAVFGLLGSLVFAAAWLHTAGMPLWVVCVFFICGDVVVFGVGAGDC
jgi:hypothetical protein